MQVFSIASIPSLHFGPGKISVLSSIVKPYGTRVLLVTGARSFAASRHAPEILDRAREQGLVVEQVPIDREPTPAMIDAAVENFRAYAPSAVVAIGGGSVLDAGKAISAMLPLNKPVKDYLEGVGTAQHPGLKIPFIAVPTTAGTGSEATKNAVLSETGAAGFKKSLRHNHFVPDAAIVDPVLTLSCSPAVTAASGMDAFTQLLESYVSTAANPFTDALALEGLACVARSLTTAYHRGDDLDARTGMALAAYLSGITLANAGLGLVHGFASSVGGFFAIPHGVICSSLMAAANAVTVRKLRALHMPAPLSKYATAGRLFTDVKNQSEAYYADCLVDVQRAWTDAMKIPRLSEGGVAISDHAKIVSATDNKNNPVPLNAEEMREVLARAG